MNGPINSAVDDREYAVPDVNFYSTFAHSPHLNVQQKYAPPVIPPAATYMCSPRLIRPMTRHCYPTLKPINPHCCIHQQYLTMQTRQSTKSASNSNVITYAPTEDFPPIEAPCGNSFMVKCSSSDDHQSININEIHSDRLTLMEKMADGLFGSLHVAELTSFNHEKQLVIVKSLKDTSDEKNK